MIVWREGGTGWQSGGTAESRLRVKLIHHFWLRLNQPTLILTDGPEAVRAFMAEFENGLGML